MIVVGVDPHKKSHTAVAVCAATGQVVGQRMVAASEAGHRALAGWIIGLDHARVAIEDVRNVSGRLERALIESGLEVVRVPPRLMGQSRRAARQRGKSDPIDAAAVARAALADPELAAGRLAGAELELHLLVSHRDDLVAERTRTQARLRWHLHALGIGLAVPPRALERALWLDRIADALAQRAEVRARVAAELVAECRRSSRRVRALEREIAQLVRQQAPELLQIPGCGPLTAAKIVGQVAGLERFASPAQLARYAGVAPVPASSGSWQRHRLDRAGNRQLNCALYRIAITQERCHPPAQQYIARRIRQGKSPREARRCLKRHLVNVIFRTMRAGPHTPSPGVRSERD